MHDSLTQNRLVTRKYLELILSEWLARLRNNFNNVKYQNL